MKRRKRKSIRRNRRHSRRSTRRNKGKYSSFVKKHKGLFKRLGFKAASKKIGKMWRNK